MVGFSWRNYSVLVSIVALVLLCGVCFQFTRGAASSGTPAPLPEVRISASALVASSVPAENLRPLLKGTEIVGVASEAKQVLSVQVRPKNAQETPSRASAVDSVVLCEPVDLRIALWDEHGTPRAAVSDLNGGEVQAHLEFLAPRRKQNRVGLGISATGAETRSVASYSREVLPDVWVRSELSKGRSGLGIGIGVEYQF